LTSGRRYYSKGNKQSKCNHDKWIKCLDAEQRKQVKCAGILGFTCQNEASDMLQILDSNDYVAIQFNTLKSKLWVANKTPS